MEILTFWDILKKKNVAFELLIIKLRKRLNVKFSIKCLENSLLDTYRYSQKTTKEMPYNMEW